MTRIAGYVSATLLEWQRRAIERNVTAVAPGKFVFFAGVNSTRSIGTNPIFSEDPFSTAVFAPTEQIRVAKQPDENGPAPRAITMRP